MVYEKRQQSSLAHWMQPRLVKIGAKDDVLREVEAMKQVSSYIPFELRPNYEAHAAGFTRALYVADFIDKSESLLDAAHDGRAEAALSALFFRTLGVWRDCASQRRLSDESLADAAERLKMFSVDKIRPEYLQSPEFADSGIDPSALWAKAKEIHFGHRVATIHGDLHGRNVRVRGEDAIVIDLAEIKGTDEEGEGAPLCFDVAMLDVALGFQCLDKLAKAGTIDSFQQPEWTEEIESYYNFESLLNGPPKNEQRLGRWLHGCLQRIRAFANYDQSNQLEYPIAVAIAMWRWCKFRYEGDKDKGRRIKALLLGAAILEKAIKLHEESQRGNE